MSFADAQRIKRAEASLAQAQADIETLKLRVEALEQRKLSLPRKEARSAD